MQANVIVGTMHAFVMGVWWNQRCTFVNDALHQLWWIGTESSTRIDTATVAIGADRIIEEVCCCVGILFFVWQSR